MAADSLTRGTTQNTQSAISNYLAVEPMPTAQSSCTRGNSSSMDFPSMAYMSMLNNLGPHRTASMMYVTLQDELQMQEARALFLHTAEKHGFSDNPIRTVRDCTVNFGSWPSHGQGLPSDLNQRYATAHQIL